MNLSVIEPLNMLFKDEVRNVGKELKIKQEILEDIHFQDQVLV